MFLSGRITFLAGGGIGRHKGLKIPRRRLRAGSSPAPGTTQNPFTNFEIRFFADDNLSSNRRF